MGILEAYKHAFKTGIAMSKPTSICQVIQKTGTTAKSHMVSAMYIICCRFGIRDNILCFSFFIIFLFPSYIKAGTKSKGNQQYHILCIFTNGNVHDVEATKAVLNAVQNEPLSIVVVGVGPGNFNNMQFLNEFKPQGGSPSRVQFVEMKSGGGLANKTLKEIPDQLVSFYVAHNIAPNNPIEPDEIVIEPYKEEDDKPDKPGKKNELLEKVKSQGMRQVMRQGKRILNQQVGKIFGVRGRRPLSKQGMVDMLCDKQVNKFTNKIFN
jgi:hypothetical protein